MNDLTQADFVQLAIYGLFGLYISAAVVRMFRGRFLSGVAALAFWIVAFGAVVTGYSYREELGAVAARVIATVVPGTPIDSGPREVTVLRAPDGQFTVRGQSGKARLTFVLDTGASAVVLRAEDARRVGIDTRRLSYEALVSTANGSAMTAEAVLPELVIGTIRETDVPVLIAKPGALGENLLGMTFLNRLASFSVARNRLVLRGS